MLSADSVTPSSFSHVHSVATDDVMLFSTDGPGVSLEDARKLDDSMLASGMVRHKGKDVNDQTGAVCIGLALENGTHWSAPLARCLSMILMVTMLVSHMVASPSQIQQVLGTIQWYDLLCRPKLSVFNRSYAFAGDGRDDTLRALPAVVAGELILSVVLGVFWSSDLRRPLLPLVCCSDASTSFGFGGSVLRTTDAIAQQFARVACKHDVFAVLDDGAAAAEYAKRIGELHAIRVAKGDFTHVFSVRRWHTDNINMLEGEAMLIMLRWILRSCARHSSRVVILLDSSAVLGAAAKGRSSSRVGRIMRRAAALELAGDLMVYLVLVPSAENPSDIPSRGRWQD